MKTTPITSPESILADPNLFQQLNAAEQLATVLSAKSNLDAIVSAMEADLKIRQNSIDQARQTLIAPKKLAAKNLKAQAEQLVNDHRKAIMGDGKTLELCGHGIGFRFTNTIECDVDEETSIAAMEVMASDDTASDADRMSAEACLKRGKTTLNKSFCQNAAKKSAAWLRVFGIRLVRAEKLSIKPLNSAEEEE